MKRTVKRTKYTRELPREMYKYFLAYSGAGVPSFRKFATSIGVTLAELVSFKSHRKFAKAYEECSEIRRDYLIDKALTRSHDAAFTKFLLDREYGNESGEDDALKILFEVVE